jgi:hypothetical protein
MARSYDDVISDDRFEDAELFTHCEDCYVRLVTVFEEMDGLCAGCQRLADRLAAEELDA